MKRLLLVLLPLLLVACGSSPTGPSTPPAAVTSVTLTLRTINAADLAPIADATIGIASQSLRTNAAGDVSVTVDVNRAYTIDIQATGFDAVHQSITVSVPTAWTFQLHRS